MAVVRLARLLAGPFHTAVMAVSLRAAFPGRLSCAVNGACVTVLPFMTQLAMLTEAAKSSLLPAMYVIAEGGA